MVVDMSRHMTRSEVARELGISGQRVTQIAQAGKIKFIETRLGRLYPESEVERLKRVRREHHSGNHRK